MPSHVWMFLSVEVSGRQRKFAGVGYEFIRSLKVWMVLIVRIR